MSWFDKLSKKQIAIIAGLIIFFVILLAATIITHPMEENEKGNNLPNTPVINNTTKIDDNNETNISNNVNTTEASAKYVGSSYKNEGTDLKFHYPGCEWAKKISENNLIEFENRYEAINAGYRPCQVCKP